VFTDRVPERADSHLGSNSDYGSVGRILESQDTDIVRSVPRSKSWPTNTWRFTTNRPTRIT